MGNGWRALRRRILTPDVSETSLEKRGFHRKSPAAQERLETIGEKFLLGYAHAVEARSAEQAEEWLERIPPQFRGFAYEGAGIGYGVLDGLPFGKSTNTAEFLAGPGEKHDYIIYVGVGWAMCRLPRFAWPKASAFDPLLRWLPYDGYGFHQAFFASGGANLVHGPLKWAPYAHRAFHQGVGRALWFSCGADPERIAAMTAIFPSVFATDLWSGVGLAATYAGGVPAGALATLVSEAGAAAPALAQGAIAATAARVTADNANADTELACIELCELSVDKAYALYETALDGLEPHRDPMAYETWRTRVQTYFQEAGR